MFTHPAFDMESRIVQAEFGKLVLASVYVPNGNKDYPAKLDFFRRLITWAKELREAGRELILCGDMNITRTEMDVHPKERKPAGRSAAGGARLFGELLKQGLVDVGRSRTTRAVHLVGAVAQHAPAQHRLAPGLHPRLPGVAERAQTRGASRLRHERPRACSDDDVFR